MDIDHAVFLGMDLIQIFTVIVCPILFVLAIIMGATAGSGRENFRSEQQKQ